MGDDKDICVLSFSTKNEGSAKDLENFVEKGYPFVLDADATNGEQRDGMYKVFIEVERSKDTPSQIHEIVDGVTKISGLDGMKFRYYKGFKSQDCNEANLAEMVPTIIMHMKSKLMKVIWITIKTSLARAMLKKLIL